MEVKQQIQAFLEQLPTPKQAEMRVLHERIIASQGDGCVLWFSDGKDAQNKTVANPTIGYGQHTIRYANGSVREIFRIGLSPNKTGISVYIMGIEDKNYLAQTFGTLLGKASVTGYCIKFKSLKDINVEVLMDAVGYGFGL
jgi:Domain of unknown function (DU1801)